MSAVFISFNLIIKMKINGNYSDLWRAVIRPRRHEYDTADLGIFNSK